MKNLVFAEINSRIKFLEKELKQTTDTHQRGDIEEQIWFLHYLLRLLEKNTPPKGGSN